jgi:hypothetical protein
MERQRPDTSHLSMLISETHFNEKSYLQILNYTVCHANHPAVTVRSGTYKIIKYFFITK